MSSCKEMRMETKCIHAGQQSEISTGAVMMPVFQTSTYMQEGPGRHKGYEYSRTHNPTRDALQKSLAALEQAKYGFCFASGCAAATTLMMGLSPGDHVIVMDDVYGGTRRLFEKIFLNFGITFSFVDLTQEHLFKSHITKNTKMVWIESPTNPLLKVIDIKAIGDIAKNNKILVTVDNTFATPILQNPLSLGADLVVHSTTKYIGGHSDVIGGAILTNNSSWAEKISFLSNATGAIPAPWDCFLLLRGIKTLHVRMGKHCQNAMSIANYLSEHELVEKVYYPGITQHPQYEIAKKQMKAFSGMISFVVKGGESCARKICEKTKYFICAESLGGVESLIEHPASMTHGGIDRETRYKIGIEDGLLRISVGIENVSDLWQDLKRTIEL